MKLLFKITIGLFIIVGLTLALFWQKISTRVETYFSSTQPITAVVLASSPDIHLIDNAIFHQDDEKWKSNKIGQTTDSLGGYGCTITSVANAITNLTGNAITPKQLNENLSKIGGFTDRGWLIWNKVSKAAQADIKIKTYSTPSHAAIDACMKGQGYPIVKIMLQGVIQHWVMVVGRKNNEYLIRDPLEGVSDSGAVKLSERGKKIHSVRCISKT